MPPQSTYSAPAKVILFGEHFVVHGSRAVLCAVNRRATVTAQSRGDNSVSIRTGRVFAEHSLDRPLSRSVLLPFHHMVKSRNRGGVNLTIQSDIPSGAGLGSSSACCVAAAGSLLHMDGAADARDILNVAVDAERAMQPNSSGADCAACTYGGIIEYSRYPAPRVKPQRYDWSSRLRVVVSDSGMSHSTDAMVRAVKRLAKSRPDSFASLLAGADALVGRALDAIVDNDVPALGRLASKNQALLERIGVSNATLRDMIRIADSHSYGSKITGAGGGGCIVAITDESNVGQTVSALSRAGYSTFGATISAGGAPGAPAARAA